VDVLGCVQLGEGLDIVASIGRASSMVRAPKTSVNTRERTAVDGSDVRGFIRVFLSCLIVREGANFPT
jgi:hypothetical protein